MVWVTRGLRGHAGVSALRLLPGCAAYAIATGGAITIV